MELSEWKQRLAARKEVSGPAAQSISSPSWPSSRDTMEGCSPRCKPLRHGAWAWDMAALLFSSRCWRRNWRARCRCSGEEGCTAPTAATGSPASSTSPPDTTPQITGEREAGSCLGTGPTAPLGDGTEGSQRQREGQLPWGMLSPGAKQPGRTWCRSWGWQAWVCSSPLLLCWGEAGTPNRPRSPSGKPPLLVSKLWIQVDCWSFPCGSPLS